MTTPLFTALRESYPRGPHRTRGL